MIETPTKAERREMMRQYIYAEQTTPKEALIHMYHWFMFERALEARRMLVLRTLHKRARVYSRLEKHGSALNNDIDVHNFREELKDLI